MAFRFIFRLDDIAPNMHWGNYFKLKGLFEKYNIKPLIGVIPDNKDPELLKFPSCQFDFWEEMRTLQSQGWEIALHGFQHLYVTGKSGILKINNRSEFAGLGFEEQLGKLKKAKDIFNKNRITTSTFMAPSHSFDRNTLRALKKVGINQITDGYGLFPYCIENMIFLPQLFAQPKMFPFGLYTFCLHLNNMSEKDIDDIAAFLEKYHTLAISVGGAKELIKDGMIIKFLNMCLAFGLSNIRKLRMKVKRLAPNIL